MRNLTGLVIKCRRPALIAAFAAALVALLLPSAAGAATPGTLRLLENQHAFGSVTITAPDGTTYAGSPGWFRLEIAAGGAPAAEHRGFCVDLPHGINFNTTYSVSIQDAGDAPELRGDSFSRAAWLIQEADGLIAAAANTRLEAGAIQIAIWQLLGQARTPSPTSSATLNARAADLVSLSAGQRLAGPITAEAPTAASCAGGPGIDIALSGTPGTTADLAVTSGTGVVSPSAVTFDANGTATATVTSDVAGQVRVTATAEGARLRRTDGVGGSSGVQDTGFVVPEVFTATVAVAFTECGGPTPEGEPETPGVPNTPTSTPVTPSPAPDPGPAPAKPEDGASEPGESAPRRSTAAPRLAVAKLGPARILAGRVVRYRIRIRNRGDAPATGVVLTDLLPRDMSVVRGSRGLRLIGGRPTWRIGTIAPGRTVTRILRVRVDADSSGRRCNRVRARGSNASSRAARRCTRIIPLRRANLPAVTG